MIFLKKKRNTLIHANCILRALPDIVPNIMMEACIVLKLDVLNLR